ncbi:hypothetical protein FDECE_11285 [Fusarium decemcellulare]|nr:hypothetical protein FDECE_11285 [Fusarium decemcellulare]
MSSDEIRKEDFVFSDEDDRPHVARFDTNPAFFVGDKVYLLGSDGSREGPYIVASVISAEKCTLSLENYQPAKNGMQVDMAKLEAA